MCAAFLAGVFRGAINLRVAVVWTGLTERTFPFYFGLLLPYLPLHAFR